MRILKVMPFFAPATRFGGVVSQAELLCRELAQRGHVVSVITTDNGVPAEHPRHRWLEVDGYRVFHARTRPLHRCVPYWTPTIREPLQDALEECNVLTTNVGLTLMSRIAARAAGRQKIPFVYNAEGALCPTRLRVKRLQKALFVRIVETPLLRRAAAVHSQTEKDRRDAIALGAAPERVHVIPNGVEIGSAVARDRATRANWNIPEHAPLVLFLGRLHAIKGLDVLASVFAEGAPAESHLLLVGPEDDDSAERMRRRCSELGVADRVHFAGLQEPSERSRLLAEADVFALTSHSEGLPNAVLEALAAGVPCLLSEACNVPEVESAGAGFVRPLEVEALARALSLQLGDADLRARQSAAARALAAERFSMDSVTTQLLGLYEAVIEESRR